MLNTLMDEKGELLITFDDSSKERIIKSFGFNVNETSQLIDKEGKVVINQDFEPINSNEFGGILKSSKLPIKKDESELVRYFINKMV